MEEGRANPLRLRQGDPWGDNVWGTVRVRPDRLEICRRLVLHASISRGVIMTPTQIKQARRELGLTQAKMAAAMNIGTRKLERWEGGHSPISPEGARLVEMILKHGVL